MRYLSFLNPELLWFLLVVPLIYYIYLLYIRKKKQETIKFSHLELIKKAAKKSNRRQSILFYFSLTMLFLAIVALADPHIPLKKTKEGVNLVLVLDVSGSMQATDYKPSRLEAAKRAAETLIRDLRPKDNVGIVIFESGATTAAYLSPFKDRVIDKLRAIESKEGRTALGDGLSLGVDMALSIPNKKKLVVLLSDGVNNAGVISPDEAIGFAKQNNVQVFTIGMGSKEPVVLGYDWFGNPQYAELDEDTLKRIAKETGGEYFKSVDSKTLDRIYSQLSQKIKREKELTSIKDWFIISIIFLLLIELYIRYGRYRVLQ